MTKKASSQTLEDQIKRPNGFLENVKQQIGNNKKKTALLAVMLAAAPVAPILTVAAGLIIVGAVTKTGYKTYKENKAFKTADLPQKPNRSQAPKGILGNLGQKNYKKQMEILTGRNNCYFVPGRYNYRCCNCRWYCNKSWPGFPQRKKSV